MWKLDLDLTGRVALLSGAARGIGLGIARALASYGATVVLQDIDRDVAEAEAARIRDAGLQASVLGGDLADLSIAPSLVEQTVARHGSIDILVNNAAVQVEKEYHEQTVEQIEWQLRIDQVVPVLLIRAAVPHMKQRGWGRLINIGSIQGRWGNPGMLPYSMSKQAMENLTLAMSRKHMRDGITSNLIAPGWFDTPRNAGRLPDVEKQGTPEFRRRIAAGRFGKPEDCAGVAVLLCSRAGEYITGQTIYVDGGL
jgi:gluconate 5-dehydrogenase